MSFNLPSIIFISSPRTSSVISQDAPGYIPSSDSRPSIYSIADGHVHHLSNSSFNKTMRLLKYDGTDDFSFTQDFVSDTEVPPYAILSHTWQEDEEITFDEITNDFNREKVGYKKLQFCAQQAKCDNLKYFWVDTCCINKADAVELRIAISSMYQWYHNAAKCYVYLSDVSISDQGSNSELIELTWTTAFHQSRWFTRGWTLQELLAPRFVEFFSREGRRLGDKISLKRLISKATRIPDAALEGTPLSQFSVNERLSWNEHRETKVEEDKAYSLIGIFGVYLSPFYGEGQAGSFKRLMDEVDKLKNCLKDLRPTDPYDDKKRIEQIKGGLLEGSYRWVLANHNYQRWLSDPQSRLLWVKGDPGKGKTMLLCGIINELKSSPNCFLSFFFCQGIDSRINSAAAVLRGLIYLLVDQQPMLASHLQKKYDQAGRSVFEDINAFTALSGIFTSMIEDKDLKKSYLVVDALDECVVDLPKLLDLVVRTSESSTLVKWLLSSRNDVGIEQKLRSVNAESRLNLELKENVEQVSLAVDLYINHKLAHLEFIEEDQRELMRGILRRKSQGTFLWVSLIIEELESPESWDPLQVVEEAPPGLYQLYERMLHRIKRLNTRNSEICWLVLSNACNAYRPLSLVEMSSFCRLSGQPPTLARNTEKIVAMCGSFLTVRDDQIYLVHQSTKDYLSEKTRDTINFSPQAVHYDMFSRSLELISGTLKRDIYKLGFLGALIDEIKIPDNDPLVSARYSCNHWIDHLHDSVLHGSRKSDESLQDDGAVHEFLKSLYLYWLEALSLCKSVSAGVRSMAKLKALTQERTNSAALIHLVQDSYRFIRYHQEAIQKTPLQIYMSALLFSPADSITRHSFKHEEPDWLAIKPATKKGWSACLQTFEGHSEAVRSVSFSYDSTRIASASLDDTVKIWNINTGECEQTFENGGTVFSIALSRVSNLLALPSGTAVKIWNASNGKCEQTLTSHVDPVSIVAFSFDSTWLASASESTVKIWNVSSGECERTLEDHGSFVHSIAFSRDSAWLVSTSGETLNIWNTSSGNREQTLNGHEISRTFPVTMSHDSSQVASPLKDYTIRIWNMYKSMCDLKLKGHKGYVNSMAFSHNSTKLVSASSELCSSNMFRPNDHIIKIWNVREGECEHTLNCHNVYINSVIFSHDSAKLLSASSDCTIKVWNVGNGECEQTLQGHNKTVESITMSQKSALLASASFDKTIKIWDVNGSRTFWSAPECHDSCIDDMAFSHDATWLASASDDQTIKIWNVNSGECEQTLTGHFLGVYSLVFSHDSARLASVSSDQTIRIWNVQDDWACEQVLRGHDSHIEGVSFSYDSTLLASASLDWTLKIWNIVTGVCEQTFNSGWYVFITAMVMSHDATQLASGSRDGTVRIWNIASGECEKELRGHLRDIDYQGYPYISSLAFSGNSNRLASASGDLTIKIWNLSSGECEQRLGVGHCVNIMSFDSTGSCLHTEIGTIAVPLEPGPQPADIEWLKQLSSSGDWIMYDKKRILWIPSGYRPSVFAVKGNHIGIGTKSGKVWICSVNLDW